MHLANAAILFAMAVTQAHVSSVAVPATPAARIEANRIVNPAERLTVRLPKAAKYVGSERFNLYGVADAEVHVFAETDPGARLRKLYWVQFESYLPDAMTTGYNYADGNSRLVVRGTPTWVRAGPVSTDASGRPGSDREHVAAILEKAGIVIPKEVMNVRMVQLLDDPQGTGKGKRELMVIYSEDLQPPGKTLAELTTDGKPNAAWKSMEQPLIERATSAVTVTRH
jgi:hypothetical protein